MSIQLTLAYDKEKLDTNIFFPIFYVNDDIFIQPISTRHFHFVKMSLIRRGKKNSEVSIRINRSHILCPFLLANLTHNWWEICFSFSFGNGDDKWARPSLGPSVGLVS